MNRIFLSGRWTADPKTSSTAGNEPMTIAKGSIAVDRRGKDKGADFINVVVWNRQAENVARYLSKGRQIAIEGRIQTRNYDNNEGRKVYVTEVVANNVQFLESKNSVAGNNGNGFNSMPEPPMQQSSNEPTPYDFADNYREEYKQTKMLDLFKPTDIMAHKISLDFGFDDEKFLQVTNHLNAFVDYMRENDFIDHGFYSAILVLNSYGKIFQKYKKEAFASFVIFGAIILSQRKA